MRRALKAVTSYLARLMTATADGWNAFWYTPADPTLLGLIRTLTGLMLLYTHAVWGLVLHDFFGPDAWISRELAGSFQSDQFAYSLWWYVPPRWLWPVYAIMMLVLALFTAGLWTRITAVLSLVVVISFVNRVPEALFGLDKINAILTFYLAVGPSGSALSVDRWLARRRHREQARPRLARRRTSRCG